MSKRQVTRATPAKEPKKLRQLFLDFGQKKFENITCDLCGMLYSPGLESDKHAKFCKENNKTGTVYWKLSASASPIATFENLGSVILASPSDSKLKRLREIAENELGFCQGLRDSSNNHCFVFVSTAESAIGYLELESLMENIPLYKSGDSKVKSESSTATYGVLKIWVDKHSRRKGVATMLLDAARSHLGYPVAVSKRNLAFSPPTEDGKEFARSYADDFLVYKL